MDYTSRNNPFSEDRINGSINLINGNGTATFELKNLEYDEDGVFKLDILKVENLGVTVEIKGKREHFLFKLLLRLICIVSIMFIRNLPILLACLFSL